MVREALRAHVEVQRLREIQEHARGQAARRGLGPDDVEALIDELRSEPR